MTSEEETHVIPHQLNRSESMNFYNQSQETYQETEDDVYGKKRTLSCTSQVRIKKIIPSKIYLTEDSHHQSEDEPEYKRKKFQSESTESPAQSDTEPSGSYYDQTQYGISRSESVESTYQIPDYGRRKLMRLVIFLLISSHL